ncbi:hypothetical protein CYLTODRAFT_372307 [Cylindrobasidium torrendii FP15055 ss-10]|uniref:BTB domain-containing protein n=1 Tax=Cylindrobasidium torrendii FP15055 ss-10 TaxID=1314674 RepID=A0A0D7BHM8_9AGAR|nr:hypothetical protein CYLTODRAFT_372307 [Cylindrobasidium torrendii FP15055 ss-10]
MITFGEHPNFIIKSLADGTQFHVDRAAMSRHSSVFHEMFSCCDNASSEQDQRLELAESSTVLQALLRLLHTPPPFPGSSATSNATTEGSKDPKYFLVPSDVDSTTVIPLPILPLLYELIDKYELSESIERAIDEHLLTHIPQDPLHVFGYAASLDKTKIMSTASEYLNPLASYPQKDILALIPSVKIYHDVNVLQDMRSKAFRNILVKEALFPHDYGICPHHAKDAQLHWEARKFLVMSRIQCNTDISSEMRPVEENFKTCATCQKACTAAIDMLKYKCARVPKCLDQLKDGRV